MIGCDTLLNMGFCYTLHSAPFQNNPPAIGFVIYDVSRHSEKKMDFSNYSRNLFNEPRNINESYNLLLGQKIDGSSWISPINNLPTTYVCSGDPETNIGWLDNLADDKRLLIGCNIGSVSPLDTIDFKVAVLIKRGTSNLNSVTQLKNCVRQGIIGINEPPISFIPSVFKLYQNYPNPFNPITKIKFDIPKISDVKIKIFDLLGREVITLVNEKMNTGSYEREFDASDFSSGVYFYKIEADNFNEVKKMVLIK
jgi:hypothetical protein